MDVWSLGVILVDLFVEPSILGNDEDADLDSIFKSIPRWNHEMLENVNIDPTFKDFLQHCLQVDHQTRADLSTLINHPFLQQFTRLPKIWHRRPYISAECLEVTPEEIFHYWRSYGGDLESEIRKTSISAFSKPSILLIPSLVKKDEKILPHQLISQRKYSAHFLTLLNTDHIFQILNNGNDRKPNDYNEQWKYVYKWKAERIADSIDLIFEGSSNAIKLPVSLRNSKERDLVYQYHRIMKFRKLFTTFPLSYSEIKVAAVIDVSTKYSYL